MLPVVEAASLYSHLLTEKIDRKNRQTTPISLDILVADRKILLLHTTSFH